MLFQLRPESIKTFIEDKSIRLPRFQRKQTWGIDKNFKLCVSLFKDYPLGVLVIDIERKKGNKSKKWLLDGRQRQHALKLMQNPDNIYKWAKSFIGIKNTDSDEDIMEKFKDRIEEYLGHSKEDYEDNDYEIENGKQTSPEDLDEEESAEEVEEQPIDDDYDEKDNNENIGKVAKSSSYYNAFDSQYDSGLDELLKIILSVHPMRKNISEFARLFDFQNEVEDIEYTRPDNEGKLYVDTDSLIQWIKYKKSSQGDYPETVNELFNWVTSGKTIKVKENTVKNRIKNRIDKIIKIFEILEIIDQRFQESKIGYLELSNCDDDDAKKIFEIINSEGTPLTAAEILSAKPSWNKVVNNPSPRIVENKNQLYKEIGLPDQNVVKWDIAATLMDRIKLNFILGGWNDGY